MILKRSFTYWIQYHLSVSYSGLKKEDFGMFSMKTEQCLPSLKSVSKKRSKLWTYIHKNMKKVILYYIHELSNFNLHFLWAEFFRKMHCKNIFVVHDHGYCLILNVFFEIGKYPPGYTTMDLKNGSSIKLNLIKMYIQF